MNDDRALRYSRHRLLPEVGEAGQARLEAARVLCIGAGGLGSPLTMYLAAAGVGTLGLVDFDNVDVSNLQRQLLHGTSDVGRPKLQSAADTLADLNPHVRLVLHETRLCAANAIEILSDFDVIVDGTDNFATRYLVNDACVLLGKPNVYGSVLRFAGQVSVFDARRGPCYRCLFPEPPPPGRVPSCAEAGVLGVLPGTIGALQATEAIKLVLGVGRPLIGRLLTYDALAMRWHEIAVPKDPACPVCGAHPTITALADLPESCAAPMARVTVAELRARLAGGEKPTILDVRRADERAQAAIPDTLHIPLDELPARLGELDAAAQIIVHCHSGMRSAKACALLAEHGFARPVNLEGGIVAWLADQPDSS
jgi:adenylyltransferase/sulfurtransferase